MPSLEQAKVYADLSAQISVANTNVTRLWSAAKKYKITKIVLTLLTALTTGGGVLTLSKNGVNILTATNVDLQADVTSGVPSSLTLSATALNLEVSATDVLKAVWTLTTAAITNATSLVVELEPTQYW